ncbi:MAG: GNAT family N-acetyltransferase [Actinomycetota bacterium]
MPTPPFTSLHRVDRTLTRIRARGPAEVASLALDRLRSWYRSDETLLLMVREAGPVELPETSLRFRPATRADAAAYARDIGTDSARTFVQRLQPGTRCFVVEDDRRFLHASWVTTDKAWTREIAAYLAPPEGDAYVYESFTRADARGRGVYPIALAGIVSQLAEEGTTRVWVGVDERNAPSRRAIAKANFEEGFRLPYSRRWGRLSVGPASGPLAAYAGSFLVRAT